jgi:hypothetical protein
MDPEVTGTISNMELRSIKHLMIPDKANFLCVLGPEERKEN